MQITLVRLIVIKALKALSCALDASLRPFKRREMILRRTHRIRSGNRTVDCRTRVDCIGLFINKLWNKNCLKG